MPAERRREIEILFLDVGQGDATLIFPPDGEEAPVLFDGHCGHVIKATLRARGVEHLAAIVVSHLDFDHIDGLPDLLLSDWLTVDTVYLSAVDGRVAETKQGAKAAKALVDRAIEGTTAPRRWELVPAVRDGRPILSGPDWRIDLIAPEHADTQLEKDRDGRPVEANRASAIVRVTMGEHRLLIGGDAPLGSWARLAPAERTAEVFRVPHHGGALDDGGHPDDWDVARLYGDAATTDAVISVGTANGHEHPNPEWVAPLLGGACQLRCTQVTPRCHPNVATEGPGERTRMMRRSMLVEPAWRHYEDPARRTGPRNAEVPCAGTVVVTLRPDAPPEVRPAPERHATIVSLWDQPLCVRADAAPPERE